MPLQKRLYTSPMLPVSPRQRRPAASNSILVVQDDGMLRNSLRRLFESEGYDVYPASQATLSQRLFGKKPPCAVVLDLFSSESEVCRKITQVAPRLPIVVLSAKSDVADKVLLLEMGAHDYVTKPFNPRELLARVRAAVRRSGEVGKAAVFVCDNARVNFSTMEVTRDGQTVQLTAQEFKMLKFMIDNPGRVISRAEFLDEVWGYQNYPSTRTVDNHMLMLRRKLERDPFHPVHFRTVYRAGYKFVP
jgi:DNA-binding response OmpR family regulator